MVVPFGWVLWTLDAPAWVWFFFIPFAVDREIAAWKSLSARIRRVYSDD